MSSKQDRFGSLRWLVNHPVIGLLALTITVGSVPLSYLFYRWSLPDRTLAIVEPPVRSVLVQRDTPSPVRVHVGEEAVEGKDVYALQLAIWNRGNQSIRPEQVLAPLTFAPRAGERIIAASVLRKTRDICGFAVTIAPAGASAQASWRILEPGDGAVVQLVIVGDQAAPLGISGVMEAGERLLYVRQARNQSSPPTGRSLNDYLWMTGFGVTFTLGTVAYGRDLFRALRRRPVYLRKVLGELVGLLVLAILAGGVWYLLYDALTGVYDPPAALRTSSE